MKDLALLHHQHRISEVPQILQRIPAQQHKVRAKTNFDLAEIVPSQVAAAGRSGSPQRLRSREPPSNVLVQLVGKLMERSIRNAAIGSSNQADPSLAEFKQVMPSRL